MLSHLILKQSVSVGFIIAFHLYSGESGLKISLAGP